MTDEEVIARLTRKLEATEAKADELVERLSNIGAICVCIGGPLNDNVDGYTDKQLKTFSKILANADCEWTRYPN